MKLYQWKNTATGERWKAYTIRVEFQVTTTVLVATVCEALLDDEYPGNRDDVLRRARKWLRLNGEPSCGVFDDIPENVMSNAHKLISQLFPELEETHAVGSNSESH